MANELIERLSRQPIIHQGQRCVTLAQVDELHGRTKGTAKRAFNTHKDKLQEGQHFFYVPQDEAGVEDVGGTKNVPPNSGRGGNRKDVVLLTRRGYLMLSKSFQDDRAWQVQDTLVECYFLVEGMVEAARQREANALVPIEPGVMAAVRVAIREELALALPGLPSNQPPGQPIQYTSLKALLTRADIKPNDAQLRRIRQLIRDRFRALGWGDPLCDRIERGGMWQFAPWQEPVADSAIFQVKAEILALGYDPRQRQLRYEGEEG